jgi:diaminopimelate decarboxylase
MLSRIEELIKLNGTPFYLFDECGFISNYKCLEDTFKAIYPNYQISYSYKTNYTPYICNLVKQLGGYAEVVSDLEYSLAKKLGYDNSQIVYNGPSKGISIFEHIENNGILNIDSLDEAKRIVAYTNCHMDRNYTVGLRINMNVGGNFISRFGLVPGSDQLVKTINLINSTGNVKIVGLHCHISRARSIDAWAKRAQIMLDASDEYIDGIPQYISLGSGMYADMPDFLKDQFGGDSVPSYSDYAECAIRPFAEHYNGVDKKPVLFTEPGTTVVARYLNFITKVLSINEIRGRFIANMDGDYHNLGEICTMKQLPHEIIPKGNNRRYFENIDIMGFTCLEQDVLYPHYKGKLAEGDVIVFNNVGGYSIVSKPQFIKPQSAMYVAKCDGSLKQIMRAETFNDVFSKFSFDF